MPSDTSEPIAPTRRAALRAQRLRELEAKHSAAGTLDQWAPTRAPLYSRTLGEAVMTDQVVEPEAADVEVPEGLLATLAHEINYRFVAASRTDKLSMDHRVAAAIRLAEARAECKRLSLDFKKWAEGSVPQTYETVMRFARIGAAENPVEALEHHLNRKATEARVARQRKVAEQRKLSAPVQPAESWADPGTPALTWESETHARDVAVVAPVEEIEADATPIPLPDSSGEPEEQAGDPDALARQVLALLSKVSPEVKAELADDVAHSLSPDAMKGHVITVAQWAGVDVRNRGKRMATVKSLLGEFDTLDLASQSEFIRLASERLGAHVELEETS